MGDTVVLYPAQGRGHLNSTVEFGKLLLRHSAAATITIVVTTTSETSTTYLESVSAANPSIEFLRLPPLSPAAHNSLPPGCNFATAIPALAYRLPMLHSPHLRDSLSDLSKSKHIKALVLDFFCNAAARVADELGFPFYYYITSCACDLAQFLYYPVTHGAAAVAVDSPVPVPGLPSVPPEDVPAAMADCSCEAHPHFIDTAHNMARSAGLIVNTFESLERNAIRAITGGKCTPEVTPPPVYCVGPVVEVGEGGGNGNGGRSRRHVCLAWLDTQPKGSVVFLCFGSEGAFSAAQIAETAVGLERSRARFLWVVRNPPGGDGGEPDLDLGSILPPGFLDRTEVRGFVVKRWAPQGEVLSHEAVGGFVTHCGWNSVLESICAGVPMIGWPLYAEQKMNRHFMVNEMGVALELAESSEGGIVRAEELEKRVAELMMTTTMSANSPGKAVRERVMAMKAGAAAAMSDGGSSRVAITKLVESLNRDR